MFTPLGKPNSLNRINDNTAKAVKEAHRLIEDNRVNFLDSVQATQEAVNDVRSEVATLENSTKIGMQAVDLTLDTVNQQLCSLNDALDHQRHWTHDAFDRQDQAQMVTGQQVHRLILTLDDDRQLARSRETSLKQEQARLSDSIRELDQTFDNLYISLQATPRYVTRLWLGICASVVFSLILRLL